MEKKFIRASLGIRQVVTLVPAAAMALAVLQAMTSSLQSCFKSRSAARQESRHTSSAERTP